MPSLQVLIVSCLHKWCLTGLQQERFLCLVIYCLPFSLTFSINLVLWFSFVKTSCILSLYYITIVKQTFADNIGVTNLYLF